MKQTKIDLFNALKQSVELNRIVSGRIYTGWIPVNAVFPCVAFKQLSGTRGVADGKLSKININELYDVHLFAKSMLETEDMLEAVDEAMDELPYIVSRELNLDRFEEDTKIFHKVLTYRFR